MIIIGLLAYWILRSLWWERQCYTTAKTLDTASQGDICAIIQTECCIFVPDKSFNVTHLNHMKNQISALSDPFPNLDNLLKKTGEGGSWLKYLLLIPLMLLTIPFVFCLFHKIIISCITKYMSLQQKWWLDLKQLIKCIARYMINDFNIVNLDMKRCNKRKYFPGP